MFKIPAHYVINRLPALRTQAWKTVIRFPEFADWLIKVLERAMVASTALLFVAGVLFLVFGNWSSVENTRAAQVLRLLDSNWRATLLLLVPLFYLPIRRFIEELDEFRGAKRRPQEPRDPTTGQRKPPRSEKRS